MPWGGRQHNPTQWDRSAAFWHCIHRCVSHFLTRAAGNDKPCRQHDTLITVTPRKNVPLQGSSCAWCCHQGSACVPFQESRHPSEQRSPGTQPAPGKWGAKPPSGSRAADGESTAFSCAVRPQAPLSAMTPRVQMRVFQRKPKPFLRFSEKKTGTQQLWFKCLRFN